MHVARNMKHETFLFHFCFMLYVSCFMIMSRVCDICGRGSQVGNKVSHSQVKTLRKYMINLQVKKVDGKSRKVCTKCIKTMAK